MTFTMPGFRLAAVAAALLILTVSIAVACGGDDSSDDTGSPQKVPTKVGETPGQKQVHTEHAAEIDEKNLQFIPSRVTIKVGESLLFKNSETAIHDALINGKNFTGNMKNGDTALWTAAEPGEYAVTCSYHPQMKSTIIVTS